MVLRQLATQSAEPTPTDVTSLLRGGDGSGDTETELSVTERRRLLFAEAERLADAAADADPEDGVNWRLFDSLGRRFISSRSGCCQREISAVLSFRWTSE